MILEIKIKELVEESDLLDQEREKQSNISVSTVSASKWELAAEY